MRAPSLLLLVPLALAAACAGDAPTALRPSASEAPAGTTFPDVLTLPNGFSPEGLAAGRGTTFYVASLASGAVYRGDLRTGTGALLVPAQAGRSGCGLRYDPRGDRLFVAGSATGQAYVYDASTGATLATYQLGDLAAGPSEVNDMVVLPDAVYFTDDARPVLYRLPLGPGGALPPASAVQTIPLTGDFAFVPDGINANGIVATPDARWLIVGNTWTGTLYRVDPTTGRATAIDLGGDTAAWADGLLLDGHTLYVVQGPLNQVAVIRLDADFASGVIDHTLTAPALAFPSSIAEFGSALYAVNARFDVPPGPDVAYEVVRVPR